MRWHANPDYGKGVFRRRLRIEAEVGSVDVALEDNKHGFRLKLLHDGKRVEDIFAEALRHPFVTCPEATKFLGRILGCALDEDPAELRRRLIPADGCTHLLDMALLAVAHASDAGLTRLYDIGIADEQDGVILAQVDCDGERLHEWSIRDHAVVQPATLAGRSMMKGFYAWASKAFPDQALEAAMAMQRAYYVAQGGRYLSTSNRATSDGMPGDSCYSYSPGVVERAIRVEDSRRDFTMSPAKLLKFEP